MPPRELLARVTSLQNPEWSENEGLRCGGSMAEMELSFSEKQNITENTIGKLIQPDTQQLATSCPLCKKMLQTAGIVPVRDIAKVLSSALTTSPAEAVPSGKMEISRLV